MNDETLTFYYYNDGLSRAERQQVASLLATDKPVAERYQAICRELDQLGSPAPVAPPEDMVARWHEALSSAARTESAIARKPQIHTWSFIWGAAVTAALAVGIGIGTLISDRGPVEVVAPEQMMANTSNAFFRGLQVHLRDSQRGLASTPIEASEDRTLLIMNIIEQNRLFERVAQQNDAPGIARVLRAFELVLARMADEDLSPQEAAELQAKFLFELNVVLTKLAHETSDEPEVI
jgi:hypothetical protein